MRKIGEGRTAEIYEGDTGYVLKLYHNHIPYEAVKDEFRITQEINKLNLPSPKVLRIEEHSGRYGIVMEYLTGETIVSAIIKDHDNAMDLAKQMAEVHYQIHREKVSIHLPSQKAQIMEMIHTVDLLSLDDQRVILDQLKKLPDSKAICHTDFHPENILIQDQLVVIDWANACLGHPVGDVARTIMILKYAAYPEDIPKEVHTALTNVKDAFSETYLKHYCHLSGISENEIDSWLLPTMAARLSEYIPVEEKERLLHEIKERIKTCY
jgi:uncharacterized protein (TIGR02172 family)